VRGRSGQVGQKQARQSPLRLNERDVDRVAQLDAIEPVQLLLGFEFPHFLQQQARVLRIALASGFEHG
jgi:hypothetical protein